MSATTTLGAQSITQSITQNIRVQLPQFEGPLPLLLYLIRKEEMDIMNIQIHKITNQYMDFIKLMKELDLEVAGEFIAMAATLIQIKSRMLLPQYDENGEIVENEDPRKELVQRLLEYQKYQEASRSLYERPLLGRDVWSRGVRERLETKDEEIILEDNPVFALITAWRMAVRSAKQKIHQVGTKLQSIANRILAMKDLLIVGQKVPMSELLDKMQDRRQQTLITFLSILELGKMGFVSLFQTDTYQEIYVEASKPIQADAMSRVEEYGHVQAESVLEKLINEQTPELSAMKLEDEGGSEKLASEDGIEVIASEEGPEAAATDEEIALAEKELGEVSL